MAHNGDVKELILAGLVCYTLEASLSGEPTLAAKWVSTRTLRFGETGTGHAVRQSLGVDKSKVPAGFEGSWRIEYYEPDGKLAVTAFLLEIEKKDQIYYGKWASPDGTPLLGGFGFEEDGKLYMRYGNE